MAEEGFAGRSLLPWLPAESCAGYYAWRRHARSGSASGTLMVREEGPLV